jgi:hypothetical protein
MEQNLISDLSKDVLDALLFPGLRAFIGEGIIITQAGCCAPSTKPSVNILMDGNLEFRNIHRYSVRLSYLPLNSFSIVWRPYNLSFQASA